MLNDWSQQARAILMILPSLSQSTWNTQFYFGHQKPCMDNNSLYSTHCYIDLNTHPAASMDIHVNMTQVTLKESGPFVETPRIFLCMQNINYAEILA